MHKTHLLDVQALHGSSAATSGLAVNFPTEARSDIVWYDLSAKPSSFTQSQRKAFNSRITKTCDGVHLGRGVVHPSPSNRAKRTYNDEILPQLICTFRVLALAATLTMQVRDGSFVWYAAEHNMPRLSPVWLEETIVKQNKTRPFLSLLFFDAYTGRFCGRRSCV